MTESGLGETDRVHGCALGESILLNMRGHVDHDLDTIIKVAVDIFTNEPHFPALRVGVLNLLVNAVLYNPTLTLHIMDTKYPGLAASFFTKWFEAITKGNQGLPRVHDKRLSIVTLSALLGMSAAEVPASLHSGWPGIIGAALTIFKELPAAVEKREALVDAIIEDDEDEDAELEDLVADNGDMNDEDDKDVWDDDDEYLKLLADESVRLRRAKGSRGTSSTGNDDDDDDDISTEDEELEEELDVERSIDAVDTYVTFKTALINFENANPAPYTTATTALTLEQQTTLMEVMRIAQENEAAVVANSQS